MRLVPLDPRPGRPVRGLRFGADGRFLAGVVGRPDDPRRRAALFDLRADAPVAPPAADPSGRLVGDPAFAPDPRLTAAVVARAGELLVRLTDARDERVRAASVPARPWEPYSAVGFSADGDTLFVGLVADHDLSPGPLQVGRLDVPGWLDSGGLELEVDELPADDPTHPTCFADTGAGPVAVGTAAGTAVQFDPFGSPPVTVAHAPHATDPPPLDAVLFRPDGAVLVTRAAGTLVVWDAINGYELARPTAPRPLTDCAFTTDGRSLLATSLDGGIYRFAGSRWTLADRLDPGRGPLHSLAVAPDGLTAAAGTNAGAAVLWDL